MSKSPANPEKRCPADHGHGKQTCYSRHGCRCAACKKWRSDTAKTYDRERYRRRMEADPLVSARGTQRRLRALALLGYSVPVVADAVQMNHSALMKVRTGRFGHVHLSTHQKIAEVFEELSMRPATGRIADLTRYHAQGKGWAPALAYDDIDTDPEPQGVR